MMQLSNTVLRLALGLVTVSLFAAPALTQAESSVNLSYFASVTSDSSTVLSGEEVANVGDLNNDGYEDVVISAPDAGDQGEGAIYVLYGRANRIDTLVLQDLPTFTGEDTGDHLGEQIGGLGDINNDGYDDFAVVSNYHDSSITNPGTVYIIYGQSSRFTNQSVANRPRFIGERRGDGAGAAVRGAGDLNSDGYDDFAIGATWRDSRAGGVYLIYGKSSSFDTNEDLGDYTLFTGDDYDYAGSALANGDVTGDGVSDLVVAARRHNDGSRLDVGAVYIVPGRTTLYSDRPLSAFSLVLGQTAYEKIGSSLAIGDLTGDGNNDLIIGTSTSDTGGEDAGTVYVVSDPNSASSVSGAIELTSAVADDLLGTSVAAADINGDGVADLLSGAPSDLDSQPGQAFVTLGSNGLASHTIDDDYPFEGEAIHNTAGGSVAAADLNNDGKAELIIGAEQYDSEAGKVYIGYWPIYTCSNSVSLGGILANYPTTDYKLRRYAANNHMRIAVERHGRQAFLVNCVTNTVVQTLTFNERVQRKILARVFRARGYNMFIAVTRTPSKRRIKVFLYKQTSSQLVETDYFRRKWRPRGFRIKLNHRNRVVLQKGQETRHRLRYEVTTNLELIPFER